MITLESHIIKEIFLSSHLKTYDPYDIWYLGFGQEIKKIFYKNKILGIIPAGLLTFWDTFINNKLRIGYSKREYPVVHALKVLIAVNLFKANEDLVWLKAAESSVHWLTENYSKGYNGYCWGANIPWVSKNAIYDVNTPYITHTPYVLEAFINYSAISGSKQYDDIIRSVFQFLEKDLKILYEDHQSLALSYSPHAEKRIVINANCYAMYCYAILMSYFPEKHGYITNKVNKIYNFILCRQLANGGWWYYTDELAGNFIDAFHTCFVLKNLIKTNRITKLPNVDDIINKGYNYLKQHFYSEQNKMVRRFSVADNFSLTRYDLYDNAETMHLARMLGDTPFYETLERSTFKAFVDNKKNIYSMIDNLGYRRNKNMLRWAVMPYLYALSTLPLNKEAKNNTFKTEI